MEKILYFFSNKRMQQKNKILEDIIYFRLSERKIFAQVFLPAPDSDSFYLIKRKKRGRITQVEKNNLISNVKEIIIFVNNFCSKRYEFFLREYFPFVKLLKQILNCHFHFLVTENEYF